jgi:hypothetical protein
MLLDFRHSRFSKFSIEAMSCSSFCFTYCCKFPSTMDRDAKLRKLNNFRRNVPFVSQRALTAIFDEIKTNGLPELTYRHDMQEASDLVFSDHAEYGDLLAEVTMVGTEGPEGSIALNPLSYLHAAVVQGGSYTQLVLDTYARKQPSPEAPWSLVVYSDEIDAGDPLAPRGHTRKVWAFYFSFLEFGMINLSKEEAWLTVTIYRTVDCDRLDAGSI